MLLCLPNEIILCIADHMDVGDNMFFRQTCPRFSALLRAPALCDEFMRAAEASDWARQRQLIACLVCQHVRHRDKFSDGQSRRHLTVNSTRQRTCLECGKGAFYGSHKTFMYKEEPYLLCARCDDFGRPGTGGECANCTFAEDLADEVQEVDDWDAEEENHNVTDEIETMETRTKSSTRDMIETQLRRLMRKLQEMGVAVRERIVMDTRIPAFRRGT